MNWGYLSEFWDNVQEVVVSAGIYTVEWFQSVGNAVAGSIGAMFDDVIHLFHDNFLFLQYLVDNLGTVLGIIFTPLTWIFNFLKGFFIAAFVSPSVPEIEWEIPDYVSTVLNSIPYWEVLTTVIGSVIAILILIFILNKIINI